MGPIRRPPALIGFFRCAPVPTGADGMVSARGRARPRIGPDVAAIMLTNPNTCGLFEARQVSAIAEGDA